MKTFLTPLSLEEEEACLKEVQKGNKAERERLILHNMRLVAHVAKKYSGSEEDMADLISIGTIGLIKAVSAFKCDYGSRFATYAIRCIDNEMLMYFRSKKKTRGDMSLFEPIGTDKEGNQIHLVDVLVQESVDVTEQMEVKRQVGLLRKNMKEVLNEREYEIITKRYGLVTGEEKTQRELGMELGISRSYVSRIEKKALEKLKKTLIS